MQFPQNELDEMMKTTFPSPSREDPHNETRNHYTDNEDGYSYLPSPPPRACLNREEEDEQKGKERYSTIENMGELYSNTNHNKNNSNHHNTVEHNMEFWLSVSPSEKENNNTHLKNSEKKTFDNWKGSLQLSPNRNMNTKLNNNANNNNNISQKELESIFGPPAVKTSPAATPAVLPNNHTNAKNSQPAATSTHRRSESVIDEYLSSPSPGGMLSLQTQKASPHDTNNNDLLKIEKPLDADFREVDISAFSSIPDDTDTEQQKRSPAGGKKSQPKESESDTASMVRMMESVDLTPPPPNQKGNDNGVQALVIQLQRLLNEKSTYEKERLALLLKIEHHATQVALLRHEGEQYKALMTSLTEKYRKEKKTRVQLEEEQRRLTGVASQIEQELSARFQRQAEEFQTLLAEKTREGKEELEAREREWNKERHILTKEKDEKIAALEKQLQQEKESMQRVKVSLEGRLQSLEGQLRTSSAAQEAQHAAERTLQQEQYDKLLRSQEEIEKQSKRAEELLALSEETLAVFLQWSREVLPRQIEGLFHHQEEKDHTTAVKEVEMKQVLARLHHGVPSLSNTANIKFSQYNKHLTDVQQTVGRLLQQQREQCYNLLYAFTTEAEEQQRLCGITLFGAVERLQERVTQLETRTVRPAVERLVQQYYKPQVEKNQSLTLALAEAEETATQTALLVQLTESKNKGLEEQIRSFRNNVQTQQLLVQTSEELRAVKQVTTTALRDAVRDLTAICQHAPSDVLSNDFMKTIRTSALKTEAYVELYYKNSRSNASPETHRTATPPSYVYQRQTPTSGQRAREAPHGTPPPLVPSRYGNTTPKVQFQLPNGNKENVGASTPYENRFPETVKTSHQKAVYTDMLQLIHTPPTSLLPQNNNNNNQQHMEVVEIMSQQLHNIITLLENSSTQREEQQERWRTCLQGWKESVQGELNTIWKRIDEFLSACVTDETVLLLGQDSNNNNLNNHTNTKRITILGTEKVNPLLNNNNHHPQKSPSRVSLWDVLQSNEGNTNPDRTENNNHNSDNHHAKEKEEEEEARYPHNNPHLVRTPAVQRCSVFQNNRMIYNNNNNNIVDSHPRRPPSPALLRTYYEHRMARSNNNNNNSPQYTPPPPLVSTSPFPSVEKKLNVEDTSCESRSPHNNHTSGRGGSPASAIVFGRPPAQKKGGST